METIPRSALIFPVGWYMIPVDSFKAIPHNAGAQDAPADFRQMKQKTQGILCVFPRLFVKFDGISGKHIVCWALCGVALKERFTSAGVIWCCWKNKIEMQLKRFKTLFLVLLILVLAFIWGNSLLNVEKSSAESGTLVRILEKIFGEGRISEHFVRKLAHFLEFAALGFLLCGLFERYFMAAAHGLFAAVTDESLQLLNDRGSQVKDVLLDFSGVLTGALLLFLFCLLLKKWTRHQT